MQGMLFMPVIPVVRRLRQDNRCKFKASLEYTVNFRISWAMEGNPISKKKIYIENRKMTFSDSPRSECLYVIHHCTDPGNALILEDKKQNKKNLPQVFPQKKTLEKYVNTRSIQQGYPVGEQGHEMGGSQSRMHQRNY